MSHPTKPMDAGALKALKMVRELCFELDDVTEKEAWGAPTFRVGGKMFAMYTADHHGDGRLALWCNAPDGFQATLVKSDSDRYFVPPYVGKGGWVGMRVDGNVDWVQVAAVLAEAHHCTGPAKKSARKVAPTPAGTRKAAKKPTITKSRLPSTTRRA